MPGLGASFGRGAATTYQQDLANSDCILFMGSNMAEAHPVGFRWPMKAKEKGATLIHVDPRFTRTSALCDVFVGIRAGSDIAFLGGLDQLRPEQRPLVQGVRPGLHQRLDDHPGGLPGHRGPGGPVQRLRPGDAAPTTPPKGHWGYEGSPSEHDGDAQPANDAEGASTGFTATASWAGPPSHAAPRRT